MCANQVMQLVGNKYLRPDYTNTVRIVNSMTQSRIDSPPRHEDFDSYITIRSCIKTNATFTFIVFT